MSEPLQPVPAEFAQALRELGLAADEPLMGQPLTGGVSSDIWRIDTRHGPVCAKRALPKLRVAADWRAPIERNLYEARWMQVADAAVPGCAPRVLGQHPRLGVLVMSYLSPEDHGLWKQMLREGDASADVARSVGRMLARIHGYSAARPELAQRFPTDDIFFDIRLEPYLLATAQQHADLAPTLRALVTQTQANKRALVHGDVSPKNILIGPQAGAGPPQAGCSPAGGRVRSEQGGSLQPVLLDAECAWWGDPAFDIAFCLNHLLLKCLCTPAAQSGFLDCFLALAEAYLDGVDWEPRTAIERRAATLLPGLFLARVDGKSPVEYLTSDDQRNTVRRTARALLQQPPSCLADVCAAWRAELQR